MDAKGCDYLQSLWDKLYREGKITDEEYERFTQAVKELKEECSICEPKVEQSGTS